MINWILIRRLAKLTTLVCLPVFLLGVLELGLQWRELEGLDMLDDEIILRVANLALVAAMAWLGGWLWQRELAGKVDSLLELCRRLALGEPAQLPDPPQHFDELGRLGLAILVLREALVDYLSLYRRFFDVAPDMFVSLVPAGHKILDANQAFCRQVGMLPSEVLGQPITRFVNLDEGWAQALQSQDQLHQGRMGPEESTIDIEASMSLERGPGGQPWVLGVILRDTSRRNALLDELLRKSAALENALQEIKNVEDLKDQFLTTLSHELKTPMVSLKGFLQLIRQERGRPEEMGAYLDICWRNLLKLEKQINNLLDLARLSQAKDQFEMGPVDLAGLMRTAAEDLRVLASERRVGLNISGVCEQPAIVWGNREKLMQLVDNLLLNAVKYNVEDGSVRVGLEQRGHSVVLEVADSGVGIAREHMAKIFNRFYQANLTGTGRLEGLGIGLSLVQEIVLLHKGDIRVASEPGQGTTFTVILESHP